MDHQISPILSTCAIVATEITWLRMYGQFVSSAHLQDKLWIRRYVDNRAILVEDQELRTNPYIQQLASLNFYKKPVQLEDENNDNFLGFAINADNRQSAIHPPRRILEISATAICRIHATQTQWIPQPQALNQSHDLSEDCHASARDRPR